jgi:hypothetical protein
MRVNVIGLSAEMAICKEVAKQTGGAHHYLLNRPADMNQAPTAW